MMGRTYEITTPEGIMTYPSVTTLLGHVKQIPGQYYANTVIEYIKDNLEAIKSGEIPLDNTLFDSARQYHHEKLETAGDIGTEVHRMIELYINNVNPMIGNYPSAIASLILATSSPEAENSFGAFMEWAEDTDFQPIHSELTVHSHKHKFAGTLDCVAKVNGKVYIFDFKTSKAHYPENGLQIAAYRHAYEEMGLGTIEGMMVLRLDKETGEPDPKDYSKNYDKHWKAFQGILQYHYNVKNRRTSK